MQALRRFTQEIGPSSGFQALARRSVLLPSPGLKRTTGLEPATYGLGSHADVATHDDARLYPD